MSFAVKLYLERPGAFRNVRTFVGCSQTRCVLPGRAGCVPYMYVQVQVQGFFLFFFFVLKELDCWNFEFDIFANPSQEAPIGMVIRGSYYCVINPVAMREV